MFSLKSPLVRFAPWLIVGTFAVVAIGVGVASDIGAVNGRLGGDFPSFYAAGRIVLDGNGSQLYDPAFQQTAQSDLLVDGQFLYFAYPPYTAVVYSSLAWMPFGLAFGIHTALALAALVGALVAIRPLVRGYLDGWGRLGIALVACLMSYPVLRSVMGGQNATFTLLGFALVARFDDDDRPFATGSVAACLLYKPQFGLLVLALLLVGRRWRAIMWSIPVAVFLFGIGAVVTGGFWITTWLEAVADFGAENLDVNGPLMISAWGWFQNVMGPGGAATWIAMAVVLATAIPFAVATATRRWTSIPWYAAAPVILVAAPSALYYDATLTAVTVITTLAWARGLHWLAISSIVAATWLQAPAMAIGWSPLFIPILATAAAFALAAFRPPGMRAIRPPPLDAGHP